MARQATGSVVEKRRKSGTVFALRFQALGERQYLTLGSSARLDAQASSPGACQPVRGRTPRAVASARSRGDSGGSGRSDVP
jgi:hypothetical protein